MPGHSALRATSEARASEQPWPIPDAEGASRHGPLCQQGIERRPQVALGLEALQRPDQAAVLEEQASRDGVHAVLHRQRVVLPHVHPAEPHPRVVACQSFEQGQHEPAGGAQRLAEEHQDWERGCEDFLPEVGSAERPKTA
jgi:hypothetical protein